MYEAGSVSSESGREPGCQKSETLPSRLKLGLRKGAQKARASAEKGGICKCKGLHFSPAPGAPSLFQGGGGGGEGGGGCGEDKVPISGSRVGRPGGSVHQSRKISQDPLPFADLGGDTVVTVPSPSDSFIHSFKDQRRPKGGEGGEGVPRLLPSAKAPGLRSRRTCESKLLRRRAGRSLKSQEALRFSWPESGRVRVGQRPPLTRPPHPLLEEALFCS